MGFLILRINFPNSESCSENAPELSQSSEDGLFTPRAFFPEVGVVPRFLKKYSENDVERNANFSVSIV